MERFKYRAINAKGRPVRGLIAAANEVDLYNQLQTAGLELVQCVPVSSEKVGGGFTIGRARVKVRDLIQLFVHLEQMQAAGVPLLDALADVRDTTDNTTLRDIMSEVYRDVSEGTSLSEAFARHPKVFSNLYVSLVAAGEDTGDLTSSYRQLLKYLKWVDEMQSKIKKATRYPMIVSVFVSGTVIFLMSTVVPQIIGFVKNLDQELPIYTTSLMATSDFFQSYWWLVAMLPVAFIALYKAMRQLSEEFCYRMDSMFLRAPIAGNLIRKINIARYAQTFGALFAAGIDVLSSLNSARNTVSNLALDEAVDSVERLVKTGSPISEAFNASGEFPSLVVRMIKIGEESGNLTEVLDKVAEFYTKDVDEAIQGLISLIEPLLILVFAGILVWIAAGTFGPIYANLGNLTT